MPRRPRIHLDGAPLHIVQRGHNRQPCFFGEEDYQAYLYWLDEALKKSSVRYRPTLSVAADTDNTGERAHAGFSGFHFVERETACFSG